MAIAAVAALLAGAAPAAAHIDVLPTMVTQGEALELTVRVPNERDLPTTRVAIDVPEQVTVFSLGDPPPGWTVTPVRGPDGRIRSIVAGGGAIPAGRYADFTMLGTPFGDGEAVWPARQTYADGQVKPWTGPPEGADGARVESGPTDPGPAAVVTIVDGPAEAVAVEVGAGEDGSDAAVWLGVIAVAISALALLATGFLWSTRPARLPGDEDPR